MKTLALLTLMLTASLARAESIYIAQVAQGSDNGANAANAHSAVWFNTSGNWSSPSKVAGKLGPGDIGHLVGTITSNLMIQAGGISGGIITILFEPLAKMSAPTWPVGSSNYLGGAITNFGNSYITIDGGVNGLIECTANGTNLANQIVSIGINGTSASFFTVQNLTVSNLYVRVAGTDVSGGASAIQDTAKNGGVFTNFLVQHCTIHDASTGVDTDYATGCSDYEIAYNNIYNCNWGGRCGDRDSSSSMTRLLVHDNNFHDWTNWDAPSDVGYHHNGFYAWVASGGTLNSVSMYNNRIGPNFTNFLNGYNASTSGLWVDSGSGPTVFYNNIGVDTDTTGPSNAILLASPASGSVSFYNNTFNGTSGATDIGFSNFTTNPIAISAQNNIFYGTNIAIGCLFNADVSLISSHNLGFNMTAGNQFKWASGGSGGGISLASWQSATSQDSDFSTSNPLLNSAFTPASGSPARAAGTPLASVTLDASGHARPALPSIGAYEWYVSGLSALAGGRAVIVQGP